MKYITQILIAKPIDQVANLFADPENLSKWQPGLITYEPLNDKAGQEGGEARIVHQMGKREIEMKERIVHIDLPHVYQVEYSADKVLNLQRNLFERAENNSTRWISHNEFRFSGAMKLFTWMIPGLFKKQTYKYMKQFKEFAESN